MKLIWDSILMKPKPRVQTDLNCVQRHIHDSTLPGGQAFSLPCHVILHSQMVSKKVKLKYLHS